jgi:hypothetical protein
MRILAILSFTSFLATTIINSYASAKVFRNAYVSFEMPDSWKCTLEHTEWVCRSDKSKESREAIIILTAKEIGPVDSFAQYKQHLNTPQKVAAKPASGIMSRIMYPPKEYKINDQVWIDGLHMSSEVPNFFTRYLATIKDKIAVLVTFSAHKDAYSKYSPEFFKAVQSLRVVAASNLLAAPEMGPLRPGSETLGAPISAAVPSDMEGEELAEGSESFSSGNKTQMLFLSIGLLLLALGGYVYFKSKS